ncbi:glycosyltransferase [Paenibacillus sp. GbtcB18]|uniref:glycosyltransferase n=1 Tax=Paenibacillus sp. GbtcB18 TaxID=2824763 RepID=UPI002816991D|nr:glycosyltransferase [Paenibacillus sp. GbtcB18]
MTTLVLNNLKVSAKIAFVLHNLVLYETVKPILEALTAESILFDLLVPEIEEGDWNEMSRDTYLYLKEKGYPVQFLKSKPLDKYKLAFYPYLPYYIEVDADYKVRYQYGMAKPSWNLDAWSSKFDFIFCNSTYDYSVLKHYTQAEISGLIKFSYFQKKPTQNVRKRLLYLPTYGSQCSIEEIGPCIQELKEEFDITIKLHHGTTYLEPNRVSLAHTISDRVLDHRSSLVDLFEQTDLVLSDGSGAIFDAIATNTPIVVYQHNKPEYFEEIMPLEEYIILNDMVPHTTDVRHLRGKLLEALNDKVYQEKLKNLSDELFPVKGEKSVQIVMKQVIKLLRDDIDPYQHAAHKRLNNYMYLLEADKQRAEEQLQEAGRQKYEIEERKKDLEIRLADNRVHILKVEELMNTKSEHILQFTEQVSKLIKEKEELLARFNAQEEELKQSETRLAEALQVNEANQDISKQLELKNHELSRVYHELNNIYGSKRWKMGNILRTALYKTRGIYLLKGFKIWRQFGTRVFLKKVKHKLVTKTIQTVENDHSTYARKDEDKLLNWYEYKFLNYKKMRNSKYPLDLGKISISYEKELISIVLPVYNGETMIGEAIESILKQTYSNFELIILNDGSTDKTPQILNHYAKLDERIRVIHQENLKIPRTLSKGFSLAKGEFYTWTSADNNLHPNCLEIMVEELKKDENVGMVYANMKLIDETGRPLTNHGWYEQPEGSSWVILPERTLELNTYPNNTIGAAFMYRAKVAVILGDYSKFKHTLEDYDYWMRVNSLFNLKHVEEQSPIYDYRFHSQSLTSQDKELGITANRYKLMVLDDFRRDFYLSPLIWIIEGSGQLVKEMQELCISKGHTVITREDLGVLPAINLGIPISYVLFSDSLDDHHDLPDGVYKTLISREVSGDGYLMRYGDDYQKDKDSAVTAADMHTVFCYLDSKVKNDHLYKIEEMIDLNDCKYQKKLSIVVCTYKRTQKLISTLESVIEQSSDRNEYEIIIVNNDYHNVEIENALVELKKKHLIKEENFLRYVISPLKGLSYARNTGLYAARSDIMLYLDDDVIADYRLVEETINGFNLHPEAGVIGGNIILNLPEPRPEVVIPGQEALWSQLIIDGDEYKESKYQWEFPYGANFAVRRTALMLIGGFRTSYGRKGNDYAGGEEIVVSYLMNQIGFKVGLNPKSRVIHDVDTGRYTEEHVHKTLRASVITHYQLQKDLYSPMDSDINYDKSRVDLLREELSILRGKEIKENNYDVFYKECLLEAYEELIKIKEQDTENRKQHVLATLAQ